MTFPQLEIEKIKATKAIIHTNLGDLKLQLFDEFTPKTVKNFVEHAKTGYYNGVIFHRVISDFMIQGGDPTGTGMGGESIYGEKFEDEFSEDLYNLRGALSMANAGPDTNGSQFFIVQNKQLNFPASALIDGGWPVEIAKAYAENGGTPHLDGHHTVFGQLIGSESFATLDKIAEVETGFADRPLEDVQIEKIEIIPFSEKVPGPKKREIAAKLPMYVNSDHSLKIGDIFEAEVIGLQNYGAFVLFDKNKKGLVHISELKSGYIKSISDLVKLGDKFQVQVIDIDEYSQKVSLSARALKKSPTHHNTQGKHFATNYREKIAFKTLAAALPVWIKENEHYLEKYQTK